MPDGIDHRVFDEGSVGQRPFDAAQIRGGRVGAHRHTGRRRGRLGGRRRIRRLRDGRNGLRGAFRSLGFAGRLRRLHADDADDATTRSASTTSNCGISRSLSARRYFEPPATAMSVSVFASAS
jgi:hypothetical protein